MGNRTASFESFDDMQLLQTPQKPKFMESIFCLNNFRYFKIKVILFV